MNDGNQSGLSIQEQKGRKFDHSADARNEMHFQPPQGHTLSPINDHMVQQQMMGVTGGLKVQDLIRANKQDSLAQDYLMRSSKHDPSVNIYPSGRMQPGHTKAINSMGNRATQGVR